MPTVLRLFLLHLLLLAISFQVAAAGGMGACAAVRQAVDELPPCHAHGAVSAARADSKAALQGGVETAKCCACAAAMGFAVPPASLHLPALCVRSSQIAFRFPHSTGFVPALPERPPYSLVV